MSMLSVYFLSDDPLPYLVTLTSEHREVCMDGQKLQSDRSNPSAYALQ